MKARSIGTQHLRNSLLTGILALFILSPTSAEARRNLGYTTRIEFAQANPCPSTGTQTTTCPGYVIGYRIPLCAGGSDDIANFEWQPIDNIKEREALDRQACKIETRE